MRLGGWIFALAALVPALTGCGKFADKFSRINGDVTRVHFSGDRHGELNGQTLDGGLMIYFINQGDTNKGKAVGFNSAELVNSKSVLVPNGTYRVYAYGWNGSSIVEGQVRCGYGDGGTDIVLSGASRTVGITLNTSNCSFGNASSFGQSGGGNAASPTNFKTLTTRFCDGAAFPCTAAATADNYFLRAEILAGFHGGSNDFLEDSGFNLTSACTTASSSSAVLSSNLVVPVGGNGYFSPPVRLRYYADSSCASAPTATYQFLDGLSKHMSATSGVSYYLETISSSTTYYLLNLNKSF